MLASALVLKWIPVCVLMHSNVYLEVKLLMNSFFFFKESQVFANSMYLKAAVVPNLP